MMKCLSCGADNAADAKFCKSCGQPLENNAPRDTAILEPMDAYDTDPAYSYDEVEEKKPGKKKGVIIAASVFAVIVLLVLSFFIYRTSRRISLEKSAAAAIEDENYDKAREQYAKLYDMTGRDIYKERAKDAKTMAKDQELLDEAKDAFEGGNYEDALRMYTAIQNHENNLSDKARDGAWDVLEAVSQQVDAFIEADDYDSAMDMVNGLMAIAPDNSRLNFLKKEIKQGAKNLSEEKIRAATAEFGSCQGRRIGKKKRQAGLGGEPHSLYLSIRHRGGSQCAHGPGKELSGGLHLESRRRSLRHRYPIRFREDLVQYRRRLDFLPHLKRRVLKSNHTKNPVGGQGFLLRLFQAAAKGIGL